MVASIGFVSVSAEAPPAREPDDPQAPGAPPAGPRARPARPLAVTGGIAACAAAASGLAVLTTLTAIGWITAPHVGIGTGLAGVLRTSALLWLVAHHVGVTVRGAGRIGMLPLGLVLLPGALLVMAGRWVVRAGAVTRLRHVGYAALALALPYTLLAGALAVASRTAQAAPSLWQAVVASFLLAVVAGGLGAARGLAPWSRLASLLPPRPRSIVLGTLGGVALLAAAGAALAGGSLAVHLAAVRAATDALAPGPTGAALLLIAQLAYAPNAIIWAVAYMLGPGFAVGAGTVIAPTGSALGALPAFPMLAALPSGARSAGSVLILLMAVPYLAGIFTGIVTVRVMPTPATEAAALWGFAAGAAAGALTGLAAAFAGGPLGDGRLAAVGPSGWQVALVAMLELGVTAALTAAAANWLMLRPKRARAGGVPGGDGVAPEGAQGGLGGRAASPEGGPGGWVPPGRTAGGSPGGSPPRGQTDTDDAGGHRIYLNPWAEDDEPDDELPAVLQHADLAADRLGELSVTRLLGLHGVRAAHAVVVGAQLRPEHGQDDQPQRAERQAEPAEHDPADRPARACRAAAPGPAARPGPEPDGQDGEQQGHDGHEDAAAQVNEPERQPDQAEHAQRERGQGALPQRRIRRRQLPDRRHPSRLSPAPVRRLISGHRVLFCLVC
jgi:hypothetical protein